MLFAIRPFAAVIGLWLLAGAATTSPLHGAGLRVGAAAVNLEADDSMVIGGGIGPGRAQGQEGELRVVAVVLSKAADAEGAAPTKLAIVACDVLFVSRDFIDPALAEVEKATGIPPAHVLVNATHTHHAPSTGTLHGYSRDETFVKRVKEGIVEAVKQADAKLQEPQAESRFYFKMGEEKTVGANSRLLLKDNTIYWIGPMDDAVKPTGPFDPELPVLAFNNAEDKFRGLIFNHSTHTIGTRKGAVRSPGFYGLAAQELEADVEVDAVLFLEGASGSTHNLGVPTPVAVTRMKEAVTAALKGAEERPVGRLAAVKRPFTFKVRTFDEKVEEEKVVSYVKKRAAGSDEFIAGVFRDMRKQLAGQQGQERQTWLQAMLIGDVAVVGVPAECFTVLGVDIKNRSPFPDTVVAELANDWIGYLPDREGHELGGYQTWMGLHSYAEEGTGERVADEVVKMLEELAPAARE